MSAQNSMTVMAIDTQQKYVNKLSSPTPNGIPLDNRFLRHAPLDHNNDVFWITI